LTIIELPKKLPFYLIIYYLKIIYKNKMSRYGKIIENIDINKENIYTVLLDYFGDMDMIKIKDENMYSFYYAKISTMLKNGNRYLIAIVNRDNMPLDSTVPLSSLKWVCFQTRISDEYLNIPKQQYTPKKSDIFNSRIYIKNRCKESSEYGCEKFSNILITLLHVHNIEYEFPNEGTLLAALETFRTIITFV